jgi:hypothetical protein
MQQEQGPKMEMATYLSRAVPRLAAIEALGQKIDFSSPCWQYSPEGERWNRLMQQQAADEVEAGL